MFSYSVSRPGGFEGIFNSAVRVTAARVFGFTTGTFDLVREKYRLKKCREV